MKEWDRSTRECTLASLRPDIAKAIQAYIQYYNLGPILDDVLMGIETKAVKKKKGLFGRSDSDTVTAFLTPRWIVWVIEAKVVTVQSGRLQDVVVVDYQDTPGYKLIQDAGVELTGPMTGYVAGDGNSYGTYFIGLGEEPAAVKFKETLIRLVQAAKLK